MIKTIRYFIFCILGILFLSLINSSCKKDDTIEEPVFVSDSDGNIYTTIKIGKQRWFAENLKTTRYNDGSPISNITSNSSWASINTGSYCWYNNNLSMKETFGALYNWNAVASGKLCPVGWHVPSDEEWNILAETLGGESIAGGKLKDASSAYWKGQNTDAGNQLNYSALPGGSRILDGSFYNLYLRGSWWSSTEALQNTSYARTLDYEYSTLIRSTFEKPFGLSVRCIKD